MIVNNTMPGMIDQQPLVDRIMENERVSITQKENRREQVVTEKNEYTNLSGMLGDLGGLASGMKNQRGFTALALESTHPDIFNGTISGFAEPGRYEFEVDQMASPDRFLDIGFNDPKTAEVGFGYLGVEKADGSLHELTIEPGANLNDVAEQINNSGIGAKAMIVNTGAEDSPFRLMVSSVDTGEAAKLKIDPDTTFLDMENIRPAGDLKLKFEDVEVKRSNNDFKDLLEGVEFSAKKAAPGTKVGVEIKHESAKTVENISEFVGKYNALANHLNGKFQVPALGQAAPEGGRGDSNMRSIMRGLQNEVAGSRVNSDSFKSLTEIGISTNAKTGELTIDNEKLTKALSTDYNAVRDIFASGEHGVGLAERIEGVVSRFKDPVNGAITNRMKSLDQRIKNQDQDIEKQNSRLAEKEATLKSKLATMQDKVSQMNNQGAILSARFGSGTQE